LILFPFLANLIIHIVVIINAIPPIIIAISITILIGPCPPATVGFVPDFSKNVLYALCGSSPPVAVVWDMGSFESVSIHTGAANENYNSGIVVDPNSNGTVYWSSNLQIYKWEYPNLDQI